MPVPKSGSKGDKQQQQQQVRHEPVSQRRSSPAIASRDGKPMLSRKTPSDPFLRKSAKEAPRPGAGAGAGRKLAASSLSPNPSSESSKPPPPQEKKGFWSWRPWGTSPSPVSVDSPRRFHVLYSLHIHSIQNLPSALDGLRLTVHWTRQEEGLQTMPSRVVDGVAEFDEMLRQRCTVFGSRKPNNLIQYDPKLFQVSVVALDADELELGKHHIDLSRLLPEEDGSSEAGKPDHGWSTSFELSGMAKGGSLFVTFNYDLLHQETTEQKEKLQDSAGRGLPTNPPRGIPTTSVTGSKPSNRGLTEVLSKKAEVPNKTAVGNKIAMEDGSSRKEAIEVDANDEAFPLDMGQDLDEEVDLVAGEFLNMLDFGLSTGHSDSEGEPDSPRARLLKQFEYESLFGGELDLTKESTSRNEGNERRAGGGFDSKFGIEEGERSNGPEDGLKFTSMMESAESELQNAAQSARQKSRAQELEDEENQALMQRWGMNENELHKPPKAPFGPPRPPSLGKGLGSVLYLEDGGSLRSMNPSSISKNSNCGSLVMQSSKPVVVPSTIGTNAVEVLRHLASLGVDTLAKQAMTAMPLHDITGKADEVMSKGSTRPERFADRVKKSGYDDYVLLEDLAPLAMPNIESLAVDGLKIQADVAEDDAPSYLDAAAWGTILEPKKKAKDSLLLSHDLAAMNFDNLHLEDSQSSDVKEGGPLSMTLTLEEWSKLDAGVVEEDENLKEKSLAIMAAHNVDMQLVKGKGRRKKGSMGNTLMIAMLVQLRDPLQNFEAVGAPMLTLIQAERVMLPPKPRMGRSVSVTGNSEVDDELLETTMKKEETPQFKLTGVHMSGLKTSEDEVRAIKGLEAPKKGWGNFKQLQSGSRWLAAQGMAKASKLSLLKGKVAPSPSPSPSTKVKHGETLWSISARVNGSGRKWKELAALNPHIRNPDVIFANETIRTR